MSDDQEMSIVENMTERILGFNVAMDGTNVFVRLIPGDNKLTKDVYSALKASDYYKAHKEKKNVAHKKVKAVENTEKKKKKKKDKDKE